MFWFLKTIYFISRFSAKGTCTFLANNNNEGIVRNKHFLHGRSLENVAERLKSLTVCIASNSGDNL